ncbi:MAG: hypothetical protein H0U23_04525 [Blastocatellia bacterium]|nr:hypothetical protein [Blastocatellia bacterium]
MAKDIESILSTFAQAREELLRQRTEALDTVKKIDSALADMLPLTGGEYSAPAPQEEVKRPETLQNAPASVQQAQQAPVRASKPEDWLTATTRTAEPQQRNYENRKQVKTLPDAIKMFLEETDGASTDQIAQGAAKFLPKDKAPDKKSVYNTLAYLKKNGHLKVTGSRGSSTYRLQAARA